MSPAAVLFSRTSYSQPPPLADRPPQKLCFLPPPFAHSLIWPALWTDAGPGRAGVQRKTREEAQATRFLIWCLHPFYTFSAQDCAASSSRCVLGGKAVPRVSPQGCQAMARRRVCARLVASARPGRGQRTA